MLVLVPFFVFFIIIVDIFLVLVPSISSPPPTDTINVGTWNKFMWRERMNSINKRSRIVVRYVLLLYGGDDGFLRWWGRAMALRIGVVFGLHCLWACFGHLGAVCIITHPPHQSGQAWRLLSVSFRPLQSSKILLALGGGMWSLKVGYHGNQRRDKGDHGETWPMPLFQFIIERQLFMTMKLIQIAGRKSCRARHGIFIFIFIFYFIYSLFWCIRWRSGRALRGTSPKNISWWQSKTTDRFESFGDFVEWCWCHFSSGLPQP